MLPNVVIKISLDLSVKSGFLQKSFIICKKFGKDLEMFVKPLGEFSEIFGECWEVFGKLSKVFIGTCMFVK